MGLRWLPCEDLFSFETKGISLSSVSKRSVLSLTAKLFDPLGWLSPATVLAKVMIQSTWLLGVDWDTPLPATEVRFWRRFQAELPLLGNLRIPRWLGGGSNGSHLEVHGFADASVRAYAAVVYLKTSSPGACRRYSPSAPSRASAPADRRPGRPGTPVVGLHGYTGMDPRTPLILGYLRGQPSQRDTNNAA